MVCFLLPTPCPFCEALHHSFPTTDHTSKGMKVPLRDRHMSPVAKGDSHVQPKLAAVAALATITSPFIPQSTTTAMALDAIDNLNARVCIHRGSSQPRALITKSIRLHIQLLADGSVSKAPVTPKNARRLVSR
jgi:hypothetical protein